MNKARDLFLLAAVAYQAGRYEDAGSLFASCMSSPDNGEFLISLQSNVIESTASDDTEIVTRLSEAMSSMASTVDLSAFEDDEDIGEDNVDEDTDEPDPDFPGQNLPLAVVSTDKQSENIVLANGTSSPVRLKQ